MLLINRLESLQILYFHSSRIKRRQRWVLKSLPKLLWFFERISSKYMKSCFFMIFSNTFEINYKILTKQSLFLWFLDWFLKTGVILANLNDKGIFEKFIESLNWEQIISPKYSTFSFTTLAGRSFSWETLLLLKLLITFKTFFLSMYGNWKGTVC